MPKSGGTFSGAWRSLSAFRAFFFNPASLAVGTIAGIVALYAVGPAILDAIELNWLDLRFQTRGPLKTNQTVALAVIDEASIKAEGRWPWPRSRIGELVDALSDDGAKAVGFDITFAEAEENERLALIDRFAKTVESLKIDNPKLVEFIHETRVNSDNDHALTESLKRSKSPIVLGYFFHMTEKGAGGWIDRQEIARRNATIEGSQYPTVTFKGDPDEVRFLQAYAPQGNLEMFTQVAASSGYFSVVSDQDGTVRSMPMVIQSGDGLYPPMPLLTVWHALGRPHLSVRAGKHGVEGIELGERFIPTNESGQMLINYRGPPYTFPHYAVSDILAGRLPRGTFKDKIVLVGVTALGVYDIRSTPFSPVFPGLEIHANAIDNILAGDHISKPRWAGIFDLLAIVGLGGLLALALPRLSAVRGALVAGSMFVGYIVFAFWLFASRGFWLNMVYPLTAIAAVYTVLTVYRFLTEERERRRTKETFKQYVPADIVDQVMKERGGLKLGGQERVLTALFSDLEGFTSFSETNTPTQVTDILSEYYGEMTERIFSQQGTLVEYVGDELFAIFGAPMTQEDHARRACLAALAMQQRRAEVNAEWARQGLNRPPIKARTGINSGLVLVGNIGSKYRFHYSAMGDPVNLASRLEQLCKIYGIQMMISDNTKELAGDGFILRELDMVRVKGRTTPLRIYELLGTTDAPLEPEKMEMLEIFAKALQAYREQDWDRATQLFTSCLLRVPGDKPTKLMLERCAIHRDAPRIENWDGVFTHETKG